jgi:D-alanyl-D-alanine carboxypeptidase
MPDVRERLHTGLAETYREHGPGLFALVTDHGEPVFEAAAGVADLESGRPIVASDRFRIGSVTKTYVSALVLSLIADGTLAFDDTVERWLPGLVPDGDRITVELLLRMRSGLPDYVGSILGEPPDLANLQRYWSL